MHTRSAATAAACLSRGLPEHTPSEEELLAIVERRIIWFVAQNRCCRLGRIVDEVGRDEVRRVALGEGVEHS